MSNPKLSYSSKTPKQYDLRRRMVANVLQLLQSKQSSRFDHAMAISAGFFLAALRQKMYHTMCHSMCQSCNFIHDSQICFYKKQILRIQAVDSSTLFHDKLQAPWLIYCDSCNLCADIRVTHWLVYFVYWFIKYVCKIYQPILVIH